MALNKKKEKKNGKIPVFEVFVVTHLHQQQNAHDSKVFNSISYFSVPALPRHPLPSTGSRRCFFKGKTLAVKCIKGFNWGKLQNSYQAWPLDRF